MALSATRTDVYLLDCRSADDPIGKSSLSLLRRLNFSFLDYDFFVRSYRVTSIKKMVNTISLVEVYLVSKVIKGSQKDPPPKKEKYFLTSGSVYTSFIQFNPDFTFHFIFLLR